MSKTYNILDISKIIGSITKELSLLSEKTFERKEQYRYLWGFLTKNLEYLKWINKEFDLRTAEIPPYIKKKEIFYAELGINVGSEQGLRRPVVVLQNNAANAKVTLLSLLQLQLMNVVLL